MVAKIASYCGLLCLLIGMSQEIAAEVSVKNLRESLEGPFGVNRHSLTNPAGKAAARQHIIDKFTQYGLEVTVQNFPASAENSNKNNINGTNIIGVKRGKLSGTSDDRIVAVGAHYDTAQHTPGVDADGSGMAAMLEVVRVMTSFVEQKNTAIFVAFDQEEVAVDPTVAFATPCETARGADDFVCSWLLPFINSSGGPEFQGIFMLETIMNYDPRPNVQTFPAGFGLDAEALNFSGSFLLLIHKPDEGQAVAVFQQAWYGRAKDPVAAIAHNISVPITGKPGAVETSTYYEYLGRSDCLSFWVREPYFRCVFVTDTGNYRGIVEQCYHQPCDNVTSITDEKLTFLAKVTDSVLQATMKLAEVKPSSRTAGSHDSTVRAAAVGLDGSFLVLMTSLAAAYVLYNRT